MSGHLETSAATASAVGDVRHVAVEHLQRCGCTNVDHATLVLSELVTNALVHAGGAARIVIDCDEHCVSITVQDNSREPPRRRAPTPASLGGHGLNIVDRLSDDWGSVATPRGKRVWATLPIARSSN